VNDEMAQTHTICSGTLRVPLSAVHTAVSRSSGPGGQNVNKQNTRIELRVALAAIEGLTDPVEQRLRMLAGKRISGSHELRIVSQQTRSLEQNRDIAIEQLRMLLEQASHLPRKRHATRPTRASRRRRIEAKRRRGEVKVTRRDLPA
jgi:ribosome-associated protein